MSRHEYGNIKTCMKWLSILSAACIEESNSTENEEGYPSEKVALDCAQKKIGYHISLINTASSISTPVRYYSNTNSIEMVVIFISNTPSNSTACHFATGYYGKISCNDGSLIDRISSYNEQLQEER